MLGALISGVLIPEFGSGWLFVIIGFFFFWVSHDFLGAKESGNSAPVSQRLNNTFLGNLKVYINLIRNYPVFLALMVLAQNEIFGFSI
ncbi:MAG: hypothetical protein CM1200mP3_02970 [Chloroflexota bacterium]|nr:MAG: hypothetical protein CM1200mP3_02970 [Chloroflexota bacterium]